VVEPHAFAALHGFLKNIVIGVFRLKHNPVYFRKPSYGLLGSLEQNLWLAESSTSAGCYAVQEPKDPIVLIILIEHVTRMNICLVDEGPQ